jgi:hypothetical protein
MQDSKAISGARGHQTFDWSLTAGAEPKPAGCMYHPRLSKLLAAKCFFLGAPRSNQWYVKADHEEQQCVTAWQQATDRQAGMVTEREAHCSCHNKATHSFHHKQ